MALWRSGYAAVCKTAYTGSIPVGASIFVSSQVKEVIACVHKKYGDELEFLWQKSPKNAIWRNKNNHKWYAVLLTIPRNKLSGQTTDEKVEIIDLRFQKDAALDFAESQANVFPGYHMNKNNWITIILDGGMETAQILNLLDQSYEIAAQKT